MVSADVTEFEDLQICTSEPVEAVSKNLKNSDEGSIEAVSILLHEAAKLMQAYLSQL